MSWVRLEDNVMDHPKVIALSAVALRVWLRAICHCNQHCTGGFVSDRILARIGCTPKIRSELVTPPTGYASGLFDDAAGGLNVHDYATYQTPHSATKAESGRQGGIKSGATRRRNAPNSDATWTQSDLNSPAKRNRLAPDVTFDASDNHTESLTSHEANSEAKNEARARAPVPSRPVPSREEGEGPSSVTSETPSETRLRAVPDPTGDYEIADAWAQGVTKGAGSRMTAPQAGALRDLLAVLSDHGPKREGSQGSAVVAAWARQRGEAYGTATKGQVRNVFKFRDWMNSPDAPVGGVAKGRPDPIPPPYHGPVRSTAPVDPDPVAPPPKVSPFAKSGGT